VTPFVTPNDEFYRVDTALVVPQVRAEDWTLTIRGLVDRPRRLTYDELSRRELVEADITMTCVSNPVGGDLVGHARWLGVRTRELLDEAGVRSEADQLVGRSVDGYTCGFPVAAVYDRDCLVAVGMNGEPLPLNHGFPARLVTPGIYGYVGSTKWLTELEVTTFAAFDQYWARRGYAAQAPIKTMARIDTPRSGRRLAPGRIPVAGVAWAQGRRIDAVELRIDDGDFEPAVLAAPANDDSWRQWRFDWDATPGRHTLTARGVDGTGEVQTAERAGPVPDGASGRMSAPPGDLLAPDHRTAFRQTADQARRAWAGADMARSCHLRFGTFPADIAAGVNLFDVLAHTWDVGAVTGLRLDCADGLWKMGLDAAREVVGSVRDPAHYGPELPTDPGDPPAVRFLRFLGRDPDRGITRVRGA
jgi:uncharacterized protein (TIGR03086 family)